VAKPKNPKAVIRLLLKHDGKFQILANKGKGSHRMIYHPDINGKPTSMPLPFHQGKDVSPGVLNAIIRAFDLPKGFFG